MIDFTDYPNSKRKSTPSIPTILDEIFAEVVRNAPISTSTTLQDQLQLTKTSAVQEVGDLLTVVVEIPRLKRDSIAVEIEHQGKRTFEYNLVVEGSEIPLTSYLVENEQTAYKKYKNTYKIETSRPVALDGELGLSYTEGVLCIQIPLTKPVQAKKQALSARLADIEA